MDSGCFDVWMFPVRSSLIYCGFDSKVENKGVRKEYDPAGNIKSCKCFHVGMTLMIITAKAVLVAPSIPMDNNPAEPHLSCDLQ